MPIASTRPNSDSVLNEMPTAAMTKNVPISDTGMASDRNDRGAPGLQEQDDDETTSTTASNKRLDHLVDRCLDELGRVVDDRIVEAGREVLLQLLHRRLDRGRGGQRVRARPLEDDEGGRGLVVEIGVDRVVLRAELDAGDVAHAHDRAVRLGAHDDVAELLRRLSGGRASAR